MRQTGKWFVAVLTFLALMLGLTVTAWAVPALNTQSLKTTVYVEGEATGEIGTVQVNGLNGQKPTWNLIHTSGNVAELKLGDSYVSTDYAYTGIELSSLTGETGTVTYNLQCDVGGQINACLITVVVEKYGKVLPTNASFTESKVTATVNQEFTIPTPVFQPAQAQTVQITSWTAKSKLVASGGSISPVSGKSNTFKATKAGYYTFSAEVTAEGNLGTYVTNQDIIVQVNEAGGSTPSLPALSLSLSGVKTKTVYANGNANIYLGTYSVKNYAIFEGITGGAPVWTLTRKSGSSDAAVVYGRAYNDKGTPKYEFTLDYLTGKTGTTVYTLQCSWGGVTASQEITINVLADSNAPTGMTGIDDTIEGKVGETLTLPEGSMLPKSWKLANEKVTTRYVASSTTLANFQSTGTANQYIPMNPGTYDFTAYVECANFSFSKSVKVVIAGEDGDTGKAHVTFEVDSLNETLYLEGGVQTESIGLIGALSSASYTANVENQSGNCVELTDVKVVWDASGAHVEFKVTPKSAGTAKYTLKVNSGSEEKSITLTFNVVSDVDLPEAFLPFDKVYEITVGATQTINLNSFVAQGKKIPDGAQVTVNVLSGEHPEAISYSYANGNLYLYANKVGVYNIEIIVSNGTNFSISSDAVGLIVSDSEGKTDDVPALTFANKTLPNGVVGVLYTASHEATGGVGKITYSSEVYGPSKNLIKQEKSNSVEFTPTQTGSYIVRITATDARGTTATKEMTVKVSAASELILSGVTTPGSAVAGEYMEAKVNYSGGMDTVKVTNYRILKDNGDGTETAVYSVSGLNESTTFKAYIPENLSGQFRISAYVTDGVTGGWTVSAWITVSHVSVPLGMSKPSLSYTYAGATVTVHGVAYGGTGNYRYSYRIYNDAQKKMGEFTNVASASASFANLPVGKYVAYVSVSDGISVIDYIASDWFTLTPKDSKPLTMSDLVYRISDNDKSFYINKPIIEGGTGSYEISYNIYDDKGNAVNYFYSNSGVVAASPGKNGKYVVFVVVNDGLTKIQKNTAWHKLQGYEEQKPLSMSDLEFSINSKDTAFYIKKPEITGGTGVYQIAYNIYDDQGKAVNYFYSNANTVAASPGKNGKFTVFVVVSDGVSTVQKNIGWHRLSGYEEPKPLSMSDLVFSINDKGTAFYIKKPTITGGTGKYTIAYNIYDDKGNAINYFYSDANTVAASPGKNGKYVVYVVVSDGKAKVQKATGWYVMYGYGAQTVTMPEDKAQSGIPVPDATAAPTEAPAPKAIKAYMSVTEDRVPMYVEPSDSADVCMVINANEVVYAEQMVTAEDGTTWVLAQYGENEGYISADKLREMSDAEVEEYFAALEGADATPDSDEELVKPSDEEPDGGAGDGFAEIPNVEPDEAQDDEPTVTPDEKPAEELGDGSDELEHEEESAPGVEPTPEEEPAPEVEPVPEAEPVPEPESVAEPESALELEPELIVEKSAEESASDMVGETE